MSMHKGILGQQFGGATVKEDVTLEDYIHRKQRTAAFNAVAQEKKMTFEEWFKQYNQSFGLPPAYEVAEAAWKAAQENV